MPLAFRKAGNPDDKCHRVEEGPTNPAVAGYGWAGPRRPELGKTIINI
jgi:hypothetical protein